MNHENKKIIVIGAGPGGYVSAFLAADKGADVTLIEKRKNPGGVCLYEGCIPSKAYLNASHFIQKIEAAKIMGLHYEKLNLNLSELRKWKEGVVEKLSGGLGQLSQKRKIKTIQGMASFLSSNEVSVSNEHGELQNINFDYAIIACGSLPNKISHFPDSELIMDSSSALKMEDIPQKLLVLGGGYIGLELGSVYANLGSQVDVVEMTSDLLFGTDRDLVKPLQKKLEKLFHRIYFQTKIQSLKIEQKKVEVILENEKGEFTKEVFDKVLVSIGRRPNLENLNLEKIGVLLNEKGFIEVNLRRQTNIPHIYAIGDVTGQPMLAHKASHEGKVAVEAILGSKGAAFSPQAIPAVVFTEPEIAYCGIMENEAKARNLKYKVASFPWSASGRALTLDATDGLTKIVMEEETNRILGVGLVGVGVGEMISEAVLAIEMGATANDIAMSIHPHPTLSEGLMECSEIFFGTSTHVYTKPKNTEERPPS